MRRRRFAFGGHGAVAEWRARLFRMGVGGPLGANACFICYRIRNSSTLRPGVLKPVIACQHDKV